MTSSSLAWALLSGIEANNTGTGRFMQQLQAAILKRGKFDGTMLYCPVRQKLPAESMSFLVSVERLVVFHPQMLGVEQTLALFETRAARGLVTHLYMLDNFFFCLRSYNHLDHETAPCLRCAGEGNGGNAAANNCRPWPAADPAAATFIAKLRGLVNEGHVRLFAQNTKQIELARAHFGPRADITFAGLWCADWTQYVDTFLARGTAEGDGSTATAFDVVYHGSRDLAKGIGWVLAVAARTPELRYLIPIDRGAANVAASPNVTVSAMRWESGLFDAVKSSRLALTPSLWSSPCEGALIKNIVIARASAVVDIPSAFSAEIPGNVVLKLPQDPVAAATALRGALKENWRPDHAACRQWVRAFRAANESVADRLIPGPR